jgi:hypothetical protein
MASGTDATVVQSQVKEYRWYNSQSVSLELQCGLVRLELPDDRISFSNKWHNLTISSSIICSQLPMHNPPVTSLLSQPDFDRNHVVWDQVVFFPIKIRDMLMDAILTFTVSTPDGCIVGGTTMRIFDDKGCMKQGRQKLLFYFDVPADANVILNDNQTPGEKYDIMKKDDQEFIMEKHYERYRLTNCVENGKFDSKTEWLDRLLLRRIEQIQGATVIDRTQTDSALFLERVKEEYFGKSLEELFMKGFGYLIIDMPTLSYPVSVHIPLFIALFYICTLANI